MKILPAHGGNTPPKPKLIQPNFDNVPEELKAYKWAVGRLELGMNKDGRQSWSKPPMGKNGKKISKNEPEKWMSFDEVVAAWGTGNWEYVGFLIQSGTPLTVIDLDNLKKLLEDHPNTISTIMGNADALGIYWEKSISGSGIHLIGTATLPEERATRWGSHETGGFELYGAGKQTNAFMTFSGDAKNDCRRLVDAQAISEYVLETIVSLGVAQVGAQKNRKMISHMMPPMMMR